MAQATRQAIAGIVPPDREEATVMEVWPSIARTALGRALGKIYSRPGFGPLLVLLTLPLPLVLYFVPQVLLFQFRRYTLTTRRIVIREGIHPKAVASQVVRLAELDDVRIAQQPGQAFFRAADLELIAGGRVVLVLPAVKSPEAFRRIILETRDAYTQIRAIRSRPSPSA